MSNDLAGIYEMVNTIVTIIIERIYGGGAYSDIEAIKGWPPFRVWFFDCRLINRVPKFKDLKIFYKQGLLTKK